MSAETGRFCAAPILLREAPFPPAPGPVPGVAAHLKILIVTDAWRPQVNGVVRTMEVLGDDLRTLGQAVRFATPQGRFTVPMPTYPEIRLALFPRARLEKEIRDFAPE